jgi:hypothetical protein
LSPSARAVCVIQVRMSIHLGIKSETYQRRGLSSDAIGGGLGLSGSGLGGVEAVDGNSLNVVLGSHVDQVGGSLGVEGLELSDGILEEGVGGEGGGRCGGHEGDDGEDLRELHCCGRDGGDGGVDCEASGEEVNE